MGDCNSCPSKGTCGKDTESCMIESNPLNNVKKVIGVMSGKGGVGKSTVSVMLAKELRKQGHTVGVLDADITGPSTVRLLSLNGKRAMSDGNHIIPVETEDGIKVISLNLMLDDENQPVIWRGSLLSNCVKQFWKDTLWGELDYLIIDMPPGTGDVTLTVMQSIPINGVIAVSIPQNMVSMIVSKSINMAKKMNIHVYGIIENMSYILCPHCGEKIKIYNSEDTFKFLEVTDTKLLGELPTMASIGNISKDGFAPIEKEIEKTFENIIREINRQDNM